MRKVNDLKKIVDEKLYDTDTADLIHTDITNRRRYYRTRKGAFFVLYATGEIQPKTERSMKDLLGSADPEKYIEIFGKVEEA